MRRLPVVGMITFIAMTRLCRLFHVSCAESLVIRKNIAHICMNWDFRILT
jgi:hypothetical protein